MNSQPPDEFDRPPRRWVFPTLLLIWAIGLLWSAHTHRTTLFWLIIVGACAVFLVAAEMDVTKPWWISLPQAIAQEALGLVLALLFLVVAFVVQVVMRGVFVLSLSVFLVALVIAVVISGSRWLYRRWRTHIDRVRARP